MSSEAADENEGPGYDALRTGLMRHRDRPAYRVTDPLHGDGHRNDRKREGRDRCAENPSTSAAHNYIMAQLQRVICVMPDAGTRTAAVVVRATLIHE